MKLKTTILFILLLAMGVWAVLAIYFSPLPPVCAVLFAVVSGAVLVFIRPKKRGIMVFSCLFALVLGLWFSIKPSNDRNWQPNVSKLPFAEIVGNRIKIHNIRNCDYRTESDYTIGYETREFDLSGLCSIDLFMSDWGLKTIVHTLVSFGFDDGRYLCVSIETRKEVGETYSNLRGFFRQYELIYVVADERDLIGLRANYRQAETVYLYRLKASRETTKAIFLDYIRYINQLKAIPEWYNSLTGNCTTEIQGHTRPYAKKVRWDWRILANGYIDELIYEEGAMDNSLPFGQLKKESIINEKARAAKNHPDFSRLIREGLPGMKPTSF